MSFHSTRFCVVVALSVALGPRSFAKPPDLPVNEKVECREPSRIQEHEDPGRERQDQHNGRFQVTFTIDAITPAVCDWLGWCVQGVIEQFTQPARAAACPHCQRKEEGDKQANPSSLAGSVRENLQKLEKAQQLFERGEYYRRTAKPETALYYFQQVQSLCPGCSWDRLARERCQELLAKERKYANEAEESSVPPESDALFREQQRELRSALRKLADVVRDGVDIDVTGPRGVRMQCELHVGGVMYKLTMDDSGKVGYTRVPLPEK